MRSDDFMNAEDVARYLNLGKNTVYQLAKTGRLASYHVGRKLKFTLEDVEAYVASTHHAPASGAPLEAPSRANPATADEAGEGGELSAAASFGELAGDPHLIAGADPVADLLASALNAAGVPAGRLVRASYTALVNLYAGDADAAVVHLYDQASNSFNIPYVRNLAPGASVAVFRLYGREQGLIVQAGNPKRLTSWGALLREGVRLANRAKGSGSRVLLDEKLRAMEARSEGIEGYGAGVTVGSTAIRRVAGNLADVTIGCERETLGVEGVQFVPLQAEWVDLVVRKTPHSRVLLRQLKDIFAAETFRAGVTGLRPCDATHLGAIVYES